MVVATLGFAALGFISVVNLIVIFSKPRAITKKD